MLTELLLYEVHLERALTNVSLSCVCSLQPHKGTSGTR